MGRARPCGHKSPLWIASITLASPAIAVLLLGSVVLAVGCSSGTDRVADVDLDVEELIRRLDQLPSGTQTPKADAAPYLNASGEDVTASANALMSKYGIDAAQAIAQLEQESRANIVNSWLHEQLDDDPRLGESRIDHSRGGLMVISTSDSELGRKILAATSDLLLIEVEGVAVSEAELEALLKNILETLDLVDSESRLGTGVPYYTVSLQPQHGRVVIGQSSQAPAEMRSKADVLADNPLVILEDLGPVLFEHGGD